MRLKQQGGGCGDRRRFGLPLAGRKANVRQRERQLSVEAIEDADALKGQGLRPDRIGSGDLKHLPLNADRTSLRSDRLSHHCIPNGSKPLKLLAFLPSGLFNQI